MRLPLIRQLLVASSIVLVPLVSAHAQVSIGIGFPGVNIGINVPVYPELVPVPGYPVYYDPRATSNYFFYDGLYWVYQDENWYASSWYNGPWWSVGPEAVPAFVLRVPVRYYRRPPLFFQGWRTDASPRWGAHWGRDWEERRLGWNRWDHRDVPAAAPLPAYQRGYSGERYPRLAEQQQSIRSEKYRYQPREPVAQQHFQQQGPVRRASVEPPVQSRGRDDRGGPPDRGHDDKTNTRNKNDRGHDNKDSQGERDEKHDERGKDRR
jgi:hypothetical protein